MPWTQQSNQYSSPAGGLQGLQALLAQQNAGALGAAPQQSDPERLDALTAAAGSPPIGDPPPPIASAPGQAGRTITPANGDPFTQQDPRGPGEWVVDPVTGAFVRPNEAYVKQDNGSFKNGLGQAIDPAGTTYTQNWDGVNGTTNDTFQRPGEAATGGWIGAPKAGEFGYQGIPIAEMSQEDGDQRGGQFAKDGPWTPPVPRETPPDTSGIPLVGRPLTPEELNSPAGVASRPPAPSTGGGSPPVGGSGAPPIAEETNVTDGGYAPPPPPSGPAPLAPPVNGGTPAFAGSNPAGVDRFWLAKSRFEDFAKSSDPYYQKTLRDANSAAAGAGRLGSGMLRTSLGDAANLRATQLDSARSNFMNNALTGSIDDSYKNYGLSQDDQRTSFDQGQRKLEMEEALRQGDFSRYSELRRMDSTDQQTGFNQATRQIELEEALRQGDFSRYLEILNAGERNNPSGTAFDISNALGNQSSAAGQGAARLAANATGGGFDWSQLLEQWLGRGGSGGSSGAPAPAYNGATSGTY